MTINETIRKHVKTNPTDTDIKVISRLVDFLRFKQGRTYRDIFECFVRQVPSLELPDFEDLMQACQEREETTS